MSKFQLLIQQQMNEIIFHPFLFPALVSLFLVWAITKWFYRPAAIKKLPPSPWKLPILGNFHQLGSLPHRNLQSLAEKHGPLMLLHFGAVPTLVVSSADAAREIMKTHDLIFADRPQSSISRRLLYNFKDVSVAPYGEYWRQLKSICVLQLLSNKRVQSFQSIREEETALLVKKIRKSSFPVNLSEMFGELTNDVVCRSAFGRKFSEGENGKKFLSLLTEFLELLGSFTIGNFIPELSWISRVNGFDARVDKVSKEMDEFLEGVIEERMETPVGKIWEICGILCIMKSRQELDSLSLRQLLPRSGAYGNGNLSPKIQRLKSQSSSTTNFEKRRTKKYFETLLLMLYLQNAFLA
ncbi:UNVERIFIED_CONTAM: cytochrome [Sesamum radiatum]|uniref:Cytochrome n=1 Tax=Sesamum radiatum TaxID=300843 RepID=A0AAW2PKD0_SESRA